APHIPRPRPPSPARGREAREESRRRSRRSREGTNGSPSSRRGAGWPGATPADGTRWPAGGDGAACAALAARARPARSSRKALCGAKSCAAGARVAGCPRRGIDAARPPRLDTGNETAKVVGRLERRLDTATDDRSRDARRLRLLAVLGEDASKVLLSPAVHDVGCPDASVRVRTHVQRAARAKAEAPLFVGELNRGESEIQEDAVDRNETVRAGHVVEKREVRSCED